MKQKYYLVLNDQEHRLIIESLNQLRNKLIADGKYTDAVDEVLLKIISAKQKKFKVIFKGGVIMEKYIFDERNGLWYELQGALHQSADKWQT